MPRAHDIPEASVIFMPTGLRYRRAWMTFGWIAVVAALILSLIPSQMTPDVTNDKVEHALGYTALMLWFCGVYPRSRYWVVAACLVGMGILVEVLQGAMNLGRHADVEDVLANGGGIAVGWALALTILAEWPRRIEALFVPGPGND